MSNTPATSGCKGAGTIEFHIKKPMVQKYGYIDGCAACQKLRGLTQGGRTPIGRLGVNQSVACKIRIMHKMAEDPIDRHIVEAYHRRNKSEVTNQAQSMQSNGSMHNNHNDIDNTARTHLENMLNGLIGESMDVADIYSPERVITMAKRYGLNAAWALDLITIVETGRAWDFDCIHMKNKATRKLLEDKPMLLIGSPMCTEFCSWMYINHLKMPKKVVHERMRKARAHSEFCTTLYAIQINQGRYVLHEHLLGASSWKEDCIQKILGKHGVIHVKADQCQYGLMSKDKTGVGAARKATGFMTNAQCVADNLQRRCRNRIGRNQHRHVTLEGSRTKPAQTYPEELCRAICRGMIQQIEMDKKGQFLLVHLEDTEKEMHDINQQLTDKYPTVECEEPLELEQAWDDVTGAELDPAMVRNARKEEVEYIRKMKLYNKVPISECLS